MREDAREIKETLLFLMSLIVLVIIIIFTFKIRNTQDRIDRLEKQIMTEQTLEQPTTEMTTEVTTELHIEPRDDEIVISIYGEEKDEN